MGAAVLLLAAACTSPGAPTANIPATANTPAPTPVPVHLTRDLACPQIKKHLDAASGPVIKFMHSGGDLNDIPQAEFTEPLEALKTDADQAPADLVSDIRQVTTVMSAIVAGYSGSKKSVAYNDFLRPYVSITKMCRRATSPQFPDGRYVVGGNMPPGHYVTYPTGGGCYWERLDADRNIIDNNISNGARVAITIEDGDYTFSSRGCGTWVKE